MNFNPYLAPLPAGTPAHVAGKGQIESPGQVGNIIWQHRAAEPTVYENALGDALEQVFAAGAQTLAEVVAGLNALVVLAPDGLAWTEASFEATMARLGD